LFLAGDFIASRTLYADTDARLAALLTWSHYGSLLPRLTLAYLLNGVMSTLVIGLLAVALDRRWGDWVVLAATIAAVVLMPFDGVSVVAATTRFLGSIATICVLFILAIAFLPTKRQ
jgi:hypothetical protein